MPYLPLPELHAPQRRRRAERAGRSIDRQHQRPSRRRRDEPIIDRRHRCRWCCRARRTRHCSPSTRPAGAGAAVRRAGARSSTSPGCIPRCRSSRTWSISTSACSISSCRVEQVILGDQKRLVVDTFARYRIIDPLRFYQSVRHRETVPRPARTRSSIRSLRRVLAGSTLLDVLSSERDRSMRDIRDQVNAETQRLRRRVVDVRIRRADLPEENTRRSSAHAVRARARGRRSRAEGDRDGAASAPMPTASGRCCWPRPRATPRSCAARATPKRNRIFAEAYRQDPEFFAFYRSHAGLREAFEHGDTHLVLTPTANSSAISVARRPVRQDECRADGPAVFETRWCPTAARPLPASISEAARVRCMGAAVHDRPSRPPSGEPKTRMPLR